MVVKVNCLSLSKRSLSITTRQFSSLLTSTFPGSGSAVDVSNKNSKANPCSVARAGPESRPGYFLGSRSRGNVCHLHLNSARCNQQHHQAQLQDFHSILSDENKVRSQNKLTSVEPVRSWNDYFLKPDYTYAAVLVPLCIVEGEPSLLFTLRSSKLRKHRGQVSFPGGNVDKTDKDFVHTALRETEEELGIDPSAFDVWGQLNSLPSSNGRKVVYPILACAGEICLSSLHINHEEVEEAFAMSLRHLCDPANFGTTRFRDGQGYTLPVYTGGAHRVWGLTAIMVHQAMNVIAPGFYQSKIKHTRNLHLNAGKKSKKQKS